MTDETQLKTKGNSWSLEISSLEQANQSINEAGWLFFVIGIILVILSFFVEGLQLSWIDGLLLIFFGSLFVIKRNTWTAFVVLILGIGSMVSTMVAKIMGGGGGSNVFLAFVVMWAAIKAFIAVRYIKRTQIASVDTQEHVVTEYKYKKLFTAFVWISAVVFVLLTASIIYIGYFYRTNAESISSDTTGTLFTDNKFGYSLKFPPGWKLNHYPLAPGAIEAVDQNDQSSSIVALYKDSPKISNQNELLSFVKGEANYGETSQKLKTISIQPIDRSAYFVVSWRSQDTKGVYTDAYYFSPKVVDPTLAIFVWAVDVNALSEQGLESDVIKNTINSFKLL